MKKLEMDVQIRNTRGQENNAQGSDEKHTWKENSKKYTISE